MTFAVAGCGADGDEAGGAGTDLGAARRFEPFVLYYAGRSFGDLPLTNGGADDVRGNRRGPVSFVYGSCDPPPEPGDETGCAPPASIQNFPICRENLARYRGRARPRTIRQRGVPVAVFADGTGAFEKAEVFAGHTTVVLWVDDLATARRMIAELEPVNAPRSGDRLPPPPEGALHGRGQSCRS